MLNPGKISQEMCFEPHVVVSLKSILFLIGVADCSELMILMIKSDFFCIVLLSGRCDGLSIL